MCAKWIIPVVYLSEKKKCKRKLYNKTIIPYNKCANEIKIARNFFFHAFFVWNINIKIE